MARVAVGMLSASSDWTPILVAVVVGVFGIITPLVVARFVKRKVEQTTTTLHEIHVMVNARMTEAVDRINQLTAALQGSDTDVPPAPPTHTIES